MLIKNQIVEIKNGIPRNDAPIGMLIERASGSINIMSKGSLAANLASTLYYMFDNSNTNRIYGISGISDDEPDLIPLLSSEDEEQMNSEKVPEILSILPLRNTVLFPGVVIPITVGRDKSIRLIKEAYKTDKIIGVVAQKDSSVEDPQVSDLHQVGTVANIIRMLRMPDGNTTVIIQGKRRFKINEVKATEPYLRASILPLSDKKHSLSEKEFVALIDSLRDLSLQIITQSPNIPSEASFAIKNIESPSFLINFISSNMNADVEKKQQLLQMVDMKERATMVLEYLTRELQMLELKKPDPVESKN